MKRAGVGILIVLALLFGFCVTALAVEAAVIPLSTEETHALLLNCGEGYVLVGGADSEAIQAVLDEQGIETLRGIAAACDHPEHAGAVTELAEWYNAPIITPETLSAEPELAWTAEGLRFQGPREMYFFGTSAPTDAGISFRCDGTVWDFNAQTNENAVNVRSTASTKGKRVGKLQRGSFLTVTGMLLNDGQEAWYQVELEDGTTGYVRHDLLQSVTADEIEEQAKATPEPKGAQYIGNVKSKIFHYPNCRTLPAPKNQIDFDSRDDAISKGYRPCGNCNP